MSKKDLWLELLLDTKKAKKEVKNLKKEADKEIKSTGKAGTSNAGKVTPASASPVMNQVSNGLLKGQLINQGIQFGIKSYGAITDYARGTAFAYEKNDAMRDIGFGVAGATVGMVNPAAGMAISQLGAFLDTAEYKNFKDVTQRVNATLQGIDKKARGMGKILSTTDLMEIGGEIATYEKEMFTRENRIKRIAEYETNKVMDKGMSGSERLTSALERLSNIIERNTGSAPIFGFWKSQFGG